MNSEYLEIRKRAEEFLSELTIIDGDAYISNVLFELSETDNTNIEIKKQTLQAIEQLLSIKHKIKTKNEDFYLLKSLSEELNKEEKESLNYCALIKVVNSLNEEKYFITLKDTEDYINSLENKNNIKIAKLDSIQLSKLLNIIKRNF